MKNQDFHVRLGFALSGLKSAWMSEASFRTQVRLAVAALVFLAIVRPPLVWWAVFLLSIGGVLGAELINTALEGVIDRLHPEQHPMIARAKDCAAGAVLIMSLVSLGVAVALLLDQWRAG